MTETKTETPRKRLLNSRSTEKKRAKVEMLTPPMQSTATEATAFLKEGRKNIEE